MALKKDDNRLGLKDGGVGLMVKSGLETIGANPSKPKTTTPVSNSTLPTNTTLRNGSTGSDVMALQNALIEAGYGTYLGKSLDDGIYGKGTEAAVKAYQKDNGLAVDGIAGKNTLGALSGKPKTPTPTPTPAPTPTSKPPAEKPAEKPASKNPPPNAPSAPTTPGAGEGFSYDPFTYNPYEKSETVKQADAILAQLSGNAPGAWVDPYKDKYLGYLNEYENRDPFSYDFNSDALYNQYKDQYIQQGQMAMMDTMGQAAAMTGGYGNSYAQTVGQQAYNQQLGQLNEIMPELYDRAYNRYNQEGQDLLNLYGLYTGLSEQDYNKYRGDVDNYYRQLDAARNNANDLYSREYSEWADKTGMDFDVWAKETGIDFDTYKMLQDQIFTSSENEKSREFQASENDKERADRDKANNYDKLANLISSTGYTPSASELASAGMTQAEANALKNSYSAGGTIEYKALTTEETLQWRKMFEGAKDITEVETFASLLEGIVGPEAAAKWFDLYAPRFKKNPHPSATGTGGGGGGVSYWEAK